MGTRGPTAPSVSHNMREQTLPPRGFFIDTAPSIGGRARTRVVVFDVFIASSIRVLRLLLVLWLLRRVVLLVLRIRSRRGIGMLPRVRPTRSVAFLVVIPVMRRKSPLCMA